MNENVGMKMLMGIKWKHDCTFVFEELSVVSAFPYIVGLLISAIIAGLTIALPVFRAKIVGVSFKKESILEQENENSTSHQNTTTGYILRLTVYYFLYSTLHIGSMMLFMTFNGGVIVSLMVGMIIGYFIFGNKDSDSSLPVNCCAHAN